MIYLKYLKTLLRHKWFVFVEACKLGIPLLGVLHDLSKFLPDEFIPYARYFNGEYPDQEKADLIWRHRYVRITLTKEKVERDFNLAWLKHQRRNKHHWQWWYLMNDEPGGRWTWNTHYGHETHDLLDYIAIDEEEILWAITNEDDIPHFRAKIAALMNNEALPMPDRYRREMLADWRGAGKAYGNENTLEWYYDTCLGRVLHPDTQAWVEEQLNAD
jgi:hypothetical protein